jgi:tetratricopeptide (TPR) repeat protein
MERWREGNAVGAFGGRCRVHRAEILRLRGSCEEAEAEALHACDELRPWMRREFGWPLTKLGTIRLRKGDLAGAEQAFLAAHEKGWDPNPGLALLRLAQGDVASADALIRDALERPRRVPSKERPPYGLLPRAPLLDAQVEIALAAGDREAAARAAGELDEIAAAYGSRAFAAAAALARGRVALARGDADAACDACDEAVASWSDIGAPYEVAVARMALAEAHRAQGNEDQARLELRAARSSFERLGASLKAQEAAGRSGEHGGKRQADHVFRCVGDTRTIAFAGRTVLLKDLKGMRYLARLLAEPGREFHVLDLIATEHAALPATMPVDEGLAASYGGGTGPVIDDQAVRAYKRRLSEIEEDVDEAKAMGDLGRVALATADRDYLVGELSRAFGLGGRQRQSGDPSDLPAHDLREPRSRARHRGRRPREAPRGERPELRHGPRGGAREPPGTSACCTATARSTRTSSTASASRTPPPRRRSGDEPTGGQVPAPPRTPGRQPLATGSCTRGRSDRGTSARRLRSSRTPACTCRTPASRSRSSPARGRRPPM